MAGEITGMTATLSFAKGNITPKITATFSPAARDVAGSGFIHNVQTIGTAEEAILIGDVTPGYMLVRNLDATNIVHIRAATAATNTVQLGVGDIALFKHSGAAPFAIAITAPCQIEYWLFAA